ncbi:hypothetical protein B0H11DRAFT_2018302 [Mycena galericulata]|nr:hypothetical protein B0H11DRAFT_2018302 [Mycena galericulata]
MPLSRVPTSARSTSRSPLPPSPRPPNFLPPSHYAEAGGITPRQPARNDSLASSDSHYQIPLETRRNSTYMPISSNSDSSFEFGSKSKPVEHKRFSISGASKSGGGKAVGSSSRSKCESHMTNLPLVEAQLLPSLRDTIDRMTRPPSRILAPSSSPPPNGPDPNEVAPGSSPYSPSPRTWPQDSSTHMDNAHSPPPPLPSTPKLLKSALRLPTPKLQLRSPRSSTPTAPPATSRLPSAPGNNGLGSSIVKNTMTVAPTPSTPTRSRPRSRTDPGAPLQVQPDSVPKPGKKGITAGSSIPRLRPVPGLRSASSTPRTRAHESAGDESASDLELRYELDARDRRSLHVVNGVSSSESESDGEARTGVGLGLGLAGPYTSWSFASRLRARFTGSGAGAERTAADEAAERRRKELLGLVKGLDKLGSQIQGTSESNGGASDHEYGVVVSGSGRVDFGAPEPPRVMVSSSSGIDHDLQRDLEYAGREPERQDRPTSLWKRSRSFSPAPPPPAPSQPDLRAQESRRTKSPSRSPVIRQPRPTSQADESADPMPTALRRHSVYHTPVPTQPASPAGSFSAHQTHFADEDEYNLLTQSPESVYDEPEEEEWSRERDMQQDGPEPRLHARQSRLQQRHSDVDLANSHTVMLALHSRLAAARDREALGIPPSASDACAGDSEPGREDRMSYMDSGSSLARVGRSWEDGDRRANGKSAGDLSFGAEKLFRTLSGRTVEAAGGNEINSWNGDPEYAFGQGDILKGRPPVDVSRPSSLFSESSSASSVYDDSEDGHELEHAGDVYQGGEMLHEGDSGAEDDDQGQPDEPAEDAWRSTLPQATYAAVADRCGPLEIHRQETIYTLYATEEAFVARLTNTINLFILPLRMQDSKSYISGVPAEIAKLFDWLEDIFVLHTQLLSSLRALREAQYPVVECVAEAIRGSFVKRLEVYQPYLARLVNVAGTIARLVADTTSDFGEFVRIQESVRECRGWSLESLLVDPVTRLGRYPAIFRKLYEYTPKVHADYVPTFALFHSTEMVIQVMTEVKTREDEYDLVKSISHRIKGLPPSVPLARRGRRLLFRGQLLRERPDLHHDTRRPQLPVSEAPLFDDRRKTRGNSDDLKRSSKLADAIHQWDQRRGRSGSNVSSGTATSASSYSTNSSAASSEPPLTPSSPHFSSRTSTHLPRSKVPGPSRPSTPQEWPNELRPAETQLVQIFVFTDFVIVAGVSKSRYNGSEEWTLLENMGIAKVLGVTEDSDETNNTSPLLVLDILPLDFKNLGQSVVSENASLKVLHLRVSPSESPSNIEELHKTWLDAFRQSLKLTLRSISIQGGCLLTANPDADVPQLSTTQRPLPKSPSFIAEIHHGDSSSPRRQEREERGWWSSCFRQVLREFQSRDTS